MSWIEINCPHCNIELEVIASRWHGYTKCCLCNELIYIGFDEAIAENPEDWHDLQWAEKFNHEEHDLEGTFQLDYFKSQLLDA